MKYKLEELKYPIAIHIKTKEQWKLLRDKGVNINDHYQQAFPYMLVGWGCASSSYTGKTSSIQPYINIEFEDIILQSSMIEDQWYKADNSWLFKYKKNGLGGIKGSDTEFSKCIDVTNKYVHTNNWIGESSKYTITKVTDMEEVYKHFPEERTEVTSLPEKWCIKPTNKEEAKIIGRWFDENHNHKLNKYYEDNSSTYGIGYFHSNAHAKGNVYFTGSEGHGVVITFEQFKKWVLKEEPIMNTYGLKIGDRIPEKILNAWCKLGHTCYGSEGVWRSGNHFGFSVNDSRTIVKFELKENQTAVHVSGCASHLFIKAEGLKEFMDNFDKQEELPEYVECTRVWVGSAVSVVGKIYCTKEKPLFSSYTWKEVYTYSNPHFKPATKEQYDNQNKPVEVKEKSLVGRYLKVLKSYERKGHSYLLINKKSTGGLPNYTTKEYPDEWMDINYRVHHKEFELMPEGWTPEVKESREYTDEQLIEIVKAKYTSGTMFNSTGGYTNCIIPPNAEFLFNRDGYLEVRTNKAQHIGSVYSKLKKEWAEIIKKGEVLQVEDTVGYDRELTPHSRGIWRSGTTSDYQQIEKVSTLLSIKKELLLDTEVSYTELVRTQLIKPKKVVLF